MTLKSSWSIASEDDNSRHSFLSDCDSEFDLRPPPRYPAEKRSLSSAKKLLINRDEPPMTRSRAKAMEKPVIPPSPSLVKETRPFDRRRSMESFTETPNLFKTSFNQNSILFPKQEPSNIPTDGVNTLTDWLESCSLDEGKLSKNCFWPSRETNSHYMRPITSTKTSFDSNPFTMFQPSSTTSLFGQQQAQLWSRFRVAASSIRNNLWVEQLESTASSDIFSNLNNPSTFSTLSSNVFLPSLFPSSSEQNSSPLLRQRQNPMKIENETFSTFSSPIDERAKKEKSSSKFFFTLMIFAIGLVLGYLLTTTLPPNVCLHGLFFLWDFCAQLFVISFSNILEFCLSLFQTQVN